MKKKIWLPLVAVIAVVAVGYVFMTQPKKSCAQDKTTQDFASLVKSKYLADAKSIPQSFKDSFKATTGIVEGVMIMNETFDPDETGYGYNVTKFLNHEKAKQNSLDYKNVSYAIIEGGYTIIPTSSEFDNSPAFKQIKMAWKEFCQ